MNIHTHMYTTHTHTHSCKIFRGFQEAFRPKEGFFVLKVVDGNKREKAASNI